jgi:hypothetical protein
MENSNIISLLKTFSKNEMKEFDKFLRSPYFTEGKGLRHKILYDYFLQLGEFYPDFSSKQFNSELLYQKLYPGTEYNDGIMRKLNSDLNRLAEKFLIQIEMEKNEIDSRKYLLRQLSERKPEKAYIKKFNEILKYLELLEKDEKYFFELSEVWNNHWDYNYTKRDFYKLSESISAVNSYAFYVVLKSLGMYLWSISILRVVNLKLDLHLYKDLMEHVKNNYTMYEKVPHVLFRYNLIMLFISGEEDYFRELKKIKEKYFSLLNKIDKFNVYIMMTNYCYDMILKGNFQYRSERFELDKQCLSQKLYEGAGGLDGFAFLAIAKNANRLGEFKWTEKMGIDFSGEIEPSGKDFALNFVKADTQFAKRQYLGALEYLSRIKTEHFNEKQNIRNLTIMIYYEMDEYDSSLSVIDSSKHYIRSDRHLSPALKENYLKFITIAEQLVKVRENNEKNLVFQLKNKIVLSPNMLNKDWLLEKTEELEKGKK